MSGPAPTRASLTPRGLTAWAGTDRISALLPLLDRARPLTRASAPYELFVAGRTVPRALLPPLDDDLVEGDDRVRATVAVLPLGRSLIVCDRLDAAGPHTVCWPDDSSYHLLSAIPPGRRDRWLDLGCGSAVAQLARPELADQLVGLDRNPRAIAFAARGAQLSGITRFTGATGDLTTPQEPAELVTCNAPIPDGGTLTWRSTDDRFFARLWPTIPARVSERGLAVIHCVRAAIPDELPGERLVATYTPPETAPAFAVLWWRPHAPARLVESYRALTVARPHLDAQDCEVLASGR